MTRSLNELNWIKIYADNVSYILLDHPTYKICPTFKSHENENVSGMKWDIFQVYQVTSGLTGHTRYRKTNKKRNTGSVSARVFHSIGGFLKIKIRSVTPTLCVAGVAPVFLLPLGLGETSVSLKWHLLFVKRQCSRLDLKLGRYIAIVDFLGAPATWSCTREPHGHRHRQPVEKTI